MTRRPAPSNVLSRSPDSSSSVLNLITDTHGSGLSSEVHASTSQLSRPIPTQTGIGASRMKKRASADSARLAEADVALDADSESMKPSFDMRQVGITEGSRSVEQGESREVEGTSANSETFAPPVRGQSTGRSRSKKRDSQGESNSNNTPDSTASQPTTSHQDITRPRLLEYLFTPVLVLENTGSVARDHLASERTFLAYVRTSLAFASAGVALVQLFTLMMSNSGASASSTSSATKMIRFARPLGATVILIGMVLLVVGTVRYFRVQSALTRGLFPAARLSVALHALAVCAIVVAVFVGVLNVKQG